MARGTARPRPTTRGARCCWGGGGATPPRGVRRGTARGPGWERPGPALGRPESGGVAGRAAPEPRPLRLESAVGAARSAASGARRWTGRAARSRPPDAGGRVADAGGRADGARRWTGRAARSRPPDAGGRVADAGGRADGARRWTGRAARSRPLDAGGRAAGARREGARAAGARRAGACARGAGLERVGGAASVPPRERARCAASAEIAWTGAPSANTRSAARRDGAKRGMGRVMVDLPFCAVVEFTAIPIRDPSGAYLVPLPAAARTGRETGNSWKLRSLRPGVLSRRWTIMSSTVDGREDRDSAWSRPAAPVLSVVGFGPQYTVVADSRSGSAPGLSWRRGVS